MDYIKSPLNYTGNKYRILNQIIPFFPKNINLMVDLFCGGATVGINTECNKRIFIDKNIRVIGLLKHLSSIKYLTIYDELNELVKKYKLSNSYENGYAYYKRKTKDVNSNNGLKKYNENGYYKLRDDYNFLTNKNSKKANTMLYLLLLYAFNNDLRFSKNGDFNLPVGKTDLNKANLNKLEMFIKRNFEIEKEYICGDFRDDKIQKVLYEADFVYMDPPYLITDAVYNESNLWSDSDEKDLIDMLFTFLKKHKKFILSNVIEKKNFKNIYLIDFVSKSVSKVKTIDINYNYRSSSYNKLNRDAKEHEVIVLPKELFNDRNK